MSERPACESRPVDVLADADVLEQVLENSFSVYQLDFHSWMIPTRRPPGCTFWPITPPFLLAPQTTRRQRRRDEFAALVQARRRELRPLAPKHLDLGLGGRFGLGGLGLGRRLGLLGSRAARLGCLLGRRLDRGGLLIAIVLSASASAGALKRMVAAAHQADPHVAAAGARLPRFIVRPSSAVAAWTTSCSAAEAAVLRRVRDGGARRELDVARPRTSRSAGSPAPRRRTCRGCARARCAPSARTRTERACAHTEAGVVVGPRRRLPALRLLVGGVPAVRARGRELAQLVADHGLGHEHGHVLAPVVDRRSCGRPSRGRRSTRATTCG